MQTRYLPNLLKLEEAVRGLDVMLPQSVSRHRPPSLHLFYLEPPWKLCQHWKVLHPESKPKICSPAVSSVSAAT